MIPKLKTTDIGIIQVKKYADLTIQVTAI